MARRSRTETRSRILHAARELLGEQAGDLSLDQVAERVGVTRQAVLYHFASKDQLLWDVGLEALAQESAHGVAAVQDARGAHDALSRFLRAMVAFYRQDIDGFRIGYLRAQVAATRLEQLPLETRQARIYAVTDRMYSAVQRAVEADPSWPEGLDARKVVVAVHLQAVGVATMDGAMRAVGETWKSDWDAYVDALLVALGVGIGPR